MNVVCVQFDIVWEDKAANHAIVESMLEEAHVQPGTFVLLPELGDTGFSFNLDVIATDESVRQSKQWAANLARRMRIWLQHGYAERGPDGRGRNCAAIVSPHGEVVGVYRKVHPFSYGREIEYFTGGDELIIRRCAGASVCPTVCYDLRFPELWRVGAMHGAEVFTIGASWPAARQQHWRTLLIARAIENQAYVVAVNRIGRDPHLEYAGGSIIVNPMGEVLAEAGPDPPRPLRHQGNRHQPSGTSDQCKLPDASPSDPHASPSDPQPQVLEAALDLPALRDWRLSFPALRDIRTELLGRFAIDCPKDEGDVGVVRRKDQSDTA